MSSGSRGFSSRSSRNPWNVRTMKAGDEQIQKLFNHCSFDRVAIWSTPIDVKGWINTGRWIVGIPTLGISEAFSPPGGSNHWAFVAWDSKRPNDQDVFFLAQFGDGDIIPRINLQDRTIKRSEQKFQGDVLLSVEDVVKHMNASNSLKTWVERPDSSGSSRYPSPNSGGGYYRNASNLNWSRISPRSLKELNDLIYTTRCSEKKYGWRTNNCQHFAIEMYNKS